MTTDRDNVARNTSIVLAGLVLLMIGVVAIQHGQIREMRAIDCSAHMERMERVTLYENLIKFWTQQGEPEVVAAYERQRVAVSRAADRSKGACDE